MQLLFRFDGFHRRLAIPYHSSPFHFQPLSQLSYLAKPNPSKFLASPPIKTSRIRTASESKNTAKNTWKKFQKILHLSINSAVCHHTLVRFSRGAPGTGLPRCRAALAREQQPLRPTGWYSAMPDALPRAALFLPSANILNKFQIYILGEWSCCSPPHACRPGDLSPALPAPQPTDEGNNAGRLPSQPPRSQPLAQPHSPHNHLPLLTSQQPGGGLALAGGASLPHTLLLR